MYCSLSNGKVGLELAMTQRQRAVVAEWLRRWTANPMGSARVGSNPILVEIFQKNFRYRELNPGHLGESQVS